MPRNMPLVIGAALALLVLVLNSVFIVRQDRQAIILRFGAYTASINEPGTNEPGLYFKLPFFDNVVFARRYIGPTQAQADSE